MEELMTIGEFSQRSGLSPKVLRTYAEVGVLVPAAIDEASGYRYYASDQLDDAEVVGLLRRAGIPVAEIGRFLASPSADALAGWERSLVAEVQSLARRSPRCDADSPLTVLPAKESP